MAAAVTGKHVSGCQPNVVQEFRPVVRRLLPRWSPSDKEARVESAWTSRLRDPSAQIGELIRSEGELALAEEVDQAQFASRERAPLLVELGPVRIALDRDDIPAAVIREEKSRLLAAFANGCNPIGEAAFTHPQRTARLRVVYSARKRRECRVAVGSIDCAARKHIGTARKLSEVRAPHHQYRGAALAIAQQRNCRCRPRNHGLAHGEVMKLLVTAF